MIFAWTVFIIFGILSIIWVSVSIIEIVFSKDSIDHRSKRMWVMSIFFILITTAAASFIWG